MKAAALILAGALMQAASAADAPQAPAPVEIAPGVHEIAGAILPGRGPDGNTIIFDAPDGLIVVDTGRHAWHSDAILAYARERDRPIAAIVNTHWHLDHSSGNSRLKAVFPNARVYTTNAIDAALAEGGFLARNLVGAEAQMNDPSVPDAEKAETRIFIDTMAARDSLRPDVALDHDQRLRIAGRALDVHVTDGAVTASDVWLYDRRRSVAVIGDLVTLPAPFFETACPDRWSAALDAVWATPFRIAVPGHGAPMNRDQFDLYRSAFNAFIACVRSDAQAAQCANGWQTGVAQLAPTDQHNAARAYAEYYVGYLRENGGKSPDCTAS